MKNLLVTAFIALFSLALPSQNQDTFTDPRDGHVYKCITIGSQTWMAENLAYLPMVTQPGNYSYDQARYYVHEYWGTDLAEAISSDNYARYGVLYNGPASGQSCPDGWHLPKDEEWKELEEFLGMSGEDIERTNWRSSGEVGSRLKSTEGWGTGNGDNSSGFNAIPGGYMDIGGFSGHEIATFWGSNQYDLVQKWYRTVQIHDGSVYRFPIFPYQGLSVRCVKDHEGLTPTVTTAPIGFVAEITATGGGSVIEDVGLPVLARGICWSESPAPDLYDQKSLDGSGTGIFVSTLIGLKPDTKYYVRGYATNANGTDYGCQSSFLTAGGIENTLTDQRDGRIYRTVKIGAQNWMAENLSYLPLISLPSDTSRTDPRFYVHSYFGSDLTEAKAHYNFKKYGVLYNGMAATASCPTGWHLPSDGEWKLLEAGLGMSGDEVDNTQWRGSGQVGYQLKSDFGWYGINGDNSSGFNAYPGGGCTEGSFSGHLTATFWAGKVDSGNKQWARTLGYMDGSVYRDSIFPENGISVRCIQDAPIAGKVYVPDDYFEQRLIDLGLDSKLDNYVDSAAIRLVKDLIISGSGILNGEIRDLTGIEGFTALESLDCSYNKLVSLPVKSNTLLSDLKSHHNSIGSIDLDTHKQLKKVDFSNNDLTHFSIKNGTNTSVTEFNIRNNPGLLCIEVDDPVWSGINWTEKDPGAGYSGSCPEYLPFVVTDSVYHVTSESAECGGNVISEGLAEVTARGICWAASPNPSVNDFKTQDGTGSGVFKSSLTGLAGLTTYYVRAYATNSYGTTYGEQRSFTTNEITQPDMIIIEPDVIPRSISLTGTFSVGCGYFNQGMRTNQSSTLRVFLSPDPILDDTDQILYDALMLEPDYIQYYEVYGLEFPAYVTRGIWYILVLADADDEITESNEKNNLTIIDINVGLSGIASDKLQPDFKAYPNPSSGDFILSLPAETTKIQVYSSTGELIKNLYNIKQEDLIPVTLPGSGVYHIRIYHGNRISEGRVVILKD